eukprot:TRINITY_DN4922_c0_g1_i12.p1 TRINITY_DN4922_c0_g1~~TRINITY_DN4922_c0_g1_i12.p1  ORF type:complete len:189 (-),score=6.64 TRINITY_DN4922_c0_g1_i12:266-832(-)
MGIACSVDRKRQIEILLDRLKLKDLVTDELNNYLLPDEESSRMLEKWAARIPDDLRIPSIPYRFNSNEVVSERRGSLLVQTGWKDGVDKVLTNYQSLNSTLEKGYQSTLRTLERTFEEWKIPKLDPEKLKFTLSEQIYTEDLENLYRSFDKDTKTFLAVQIFTIPKSVFSQESFLNAKQSDTQLMTPQ